MKYKITGKFIIDSIGPTFDTLDQVLKAADEYAKSFAQCKPVYIRIATEEEPVEYVFYIFDKDRFHEVCRASRSAYA